MSFVNKRITWYLISLHYLFWLEHRWLTSKKSVRKCRLPPPPPLFHLCLHLERQYFLKENLVYAPFHLNFWWFHWKYHHTRKLKCAPSRDIFLQNKIQRNPWGEKNSAIYNKVSTTNKTASWTMKIVSRCLKMENNHTTVVILGFVICLWKDIKNCMHSITSCSSKYFNL